MKVVNFKRLKRSVFTFTYNSRPYIHIDWDLDDYRNNGRLHRLDYSEKFNTEYGSIVLTHHVLNHDRVFVPGVGYSFPICGQLSLF